MESSQNRYRTQLETTPWFRGLSVELRDYLVSHASLVTLERGEVLYRRGEQSYGLYAVLGGALAIGTVGVDGKEALLAVLGPTAWLGEISLFDGLPLEDPGEVVWTSQWHPDADTPPVDSPGGASLWCGIARKRLLRSRLLR